MAEDYFASPNQIGANSVMVAPWHAKIWLWVQVTLEAAFLENYSAVSAWILNGFD